MTRSLADSCDHTLSFQHCFGNAAFNEWNAHAKKNSYLEIDFKDYPASP
jgi:hypothetical protein